MSKVNQLSTEDLSRWRIVAGEKELVDAAFPGLSVDDGRRMIVTYYRTLGEFLNAYQIDTDAGGLYLSPIDGGFYGLTAVDH